MVAMINPAYNFHARFPLCNSGTSGIKTDGRRTTLAAVRVLLSVWTFFACDWIRNRLQTSQVSKTGPEKPQSPLILHSLQVSTNLKICMEYHFVVPDCSLTYFIMLRRAASSVLNFPRCFLFEPFLPVTGFEIVDKCHRFPKPGPKKPLP